MKPANFTRWFCHGFFNEQGFFSGNHLSVSLKKSFNLSCCRVKLIISFSDDGFYCRVIQFRKRRVNQNKARIEIFDKDDTWTHVNDLLQKSALSIQFISKLLAFGDVLHKLN